MKRLFRAFLTISAVLFSLPTRAALSESPVHHKIYFGSPYSPAHSAVVLLLLEGRDGEEYTCSGTLVNRSRVLTAAHCLEDIRRISVVIDGSVAIRAKSWKSHPQYNGDDQNDLGMIKLRSRAPANSQLLPICDSAPYVGESLWLFGYGEDENGNSEYQQFGSATVAGYDGYALFTVLTEGTSNTCYGDSGGPAVASCFAGGNYVLGVAGVTSYGNEDACDVYGSGSGYMRVDVAPSKSFIRRNL